MYGLLTIGVVVTLIIISTATHYLLDLTWEVSLLFGALMTVTGPTVIKPLLATVRPNKNISNILHWEGIFFRCYWCHFNFANLSVYYCF